MRLWNKYQHHGIVSAAHNAEGFRYMNTSDGSENGTRMVTRTPRRDLGNISTADPTWILSGVGQQGPYGNAGATGDGATVFCGVEQNHGLPQPQGGVSSKICFFNSYPDTGGVATMDWLLSLPYFTKFGNTPASTTDKNLVVLQLYNAGGWFWTPGGYPFMFDNNNTDDQLIPYFNFEAHMNECWNGTNVHSYYNSTDTQSLSLQGGAPSIYPSAYTNNLGNTGGIQIPYDATFGFMGSSGIENPHNIGASGEVSIEYVGQAGTGGTQYLFDARGAATNLGWFIINYQSQKWVWFNKCIWNPSSNNQKPDLKHIMIATANSSTNTSKFYHGNAFGYDGNVATGTANANMCNVGSDVTIGMRYTYSGKWDEKMSAFRVWGTELDATQAEICYAHNHARLPLVPPI